jgi:hypothetical protein
MSTIQAMRPCTICKKPTLHLVDKPNHILHLLLSVITMGLWLIVWLFAGLHARDSDGTCTVCGGVDPNYQPPAPERARPPSKGAISVGRSLGRLLGRLMR